MSRGFNLPDNVGVGDPTAPWNAEYRESQDADDIRTAINELDELQASLLWLERHNPGKNRFCIDEPFHSPILYLEKLREQLINALPAVIVE